MVSAFIAAIERTNEACAKRPERGMLWTVYPETGGYDVLLVQQLTGVQVAVEAKLTFNLKVLNQVLPGRHDAGWHRPNRGPDYRAILVPDGGLERGLGLIAGSLGVTVLRVHNMRGGYDYDGDPPWPGYKPPEPEWTFRPALPNEVDPQDQLYGDYWHPWCPEERIALPAYIPDVAAGVQSPVILSEWKIKAIKLLIVLERRGYVTRADMRFLKISPTIWTGPGGFLDAGGERGRYVAYKRTPELRKQHPRVWGEIEADASIWAEGLELD